MQSLFYTNFGTEKVKSIEEFVNIVGQYTGRCTVYVRSGNKLIVASSLMGMYSIDLTKDAQVEIESESPALIAEMIDKFRAIGIETKRDI